MVLAAGTMVRAQMTPCLQWTLLPKAVVSEIVGEASGENAFHMIMETGGYDKDRTADEFATTFHEAAFYLQKAKEYGLSGAEIARFPEEPPAWASSRMRSTGAWDALKGELWEVSPVRQKLASYVDSAAMLAEGSVTGDYNGELVWVGAGRAEDLQGKDLSGKIVVTDGSLGMVQSAACKAGAIGAIGIGNSRPFFDPLQLSWARVSDKFAFQLPPRDGEFLKKRLLAGQKITVKAQVAAQTRKTELQDVVWSIPGSDPNAGEIIFSAHLFEGYVKQGGNDDISGCAVVMEIARTLNTLIKEGRIPQPKRTIRFIIGPEYQGTGPWVKANKALMEKTLCNINLDMVGLWLSKSQSFMCMMRTTYGNPHYINDVLENYFRFVGEGNRERIQLRSNFSPVSERIVAPTGSDEPFYYSIETHYGASDHEVFNDWGVQVPGVMLIDWPDRWYHTSGDHVDKTDPTQLKRVAIIGASAAYTIASADDDMAIRIASETASNAAGRLAHQLARAIQEVNGATKETLPQAVATARAYLDAATLNEKETLETVNQLAGDKPRVGGHVALMQKGVDQIGATHLAALDAQVKAVAAKLQVPVPVLKPTDLELQASRSVPKQTAKVKANGYMGYRDFLKTSPQDMFPRRGGIDTQELQLLVNGHHSALDIKKMLDAQSETKADLQKVLDHIEKLKAAGLVEVAAPAAPVNGRKK
jgi:hypothetical protein